MTVLWHIGVSHYSEKARWALDYKRVPHRRRDTVPGAHIPIALWMTRGRHFTFPLMQLDGRVVADSTEIIAALEERHPDPPLYPQDASERRRALELEDLFDRELGPHVRLFGFHEMRRDRDALDRFAAQHATGVAARLGAAAGDYVHHYTALRFGAADSERAEAARAAIGAALDRIERELDGRDFLIGDRFTVADLTGAALLYPLVLPPEGPLNIDDVPGSLREVRNALVDRRCFRWVHEMYRRFR